MDLQTAFYIIGIIFMVVNLLLIVAILSAVLVIKAKINRVHDSINERVNQVKQIGGQAAMVFSAFRHFVKR